MKIKWNPLSRKRSIPKKNMNWTQAKRRFPRLNPFGDADRDGVKNKFDCRPFNRLRQDNKPQSKKKFIKEQKEALLLSSDLTKEEIEEVASEDIMADQYKHYIEDEEWKN